MAKLLALVVVGLLSLTSQARADAACDLTQLARLEGKIHSNRLLFVPATFGARQTQLAVVTGGWSEIRPQIATELGLRPARILTTKFTGVAGDSSTHHVVVPEFKLGEHSVRDADFLVSLDRIGESLDAFGGILGAELLATFDLEIDGRGSIVTLYRPNKFCSGRLVRWAETWTEIRFKLEDDVPILETEINGEKIATILHTGASDTLMNLNVARHLFGITPASPGVRTLGEQAVEGGKTLPLYSYTFATLDVSGLIFKNVKVVLGDFNDTDLALGMPEIGQLHLYIAYKRKRIYATRAEVP
jgi:hypothetical protein